ncbi:MAG: beta-N-acetylhexosaminidase [Candidatus Binatia bacterium]
MASLREIVGQMFMVGLSGAELTGAEAGVFADCRLGGVILFAHNLHEPEQIYTLCRALWEQTGGELAPFIAIDQEGGRVHRYPEPFTHFPPAAALGTARSPGLAIRFALATARELAAVGINLDFAPVLDVLSNPGNPVIGDRSLSAEPMAVAQLGWSIVEGLRGGGVIPCGKHFPGHGDTSADSHLELPVVARSEESLRRVELPPFAHACDRGIDALMTAHVLYPAWDRERPATLSQAIITGVLRQELKYDGVVFTDDLEMKAISGNYGLQDAAVLAVEAGADVLLFCHDLAQATQACERVLRRVEEDARFHQRVEESYSRIRNLKRRYLRSFTPKNTFDQLDLDSHRQIAGEITAAYKRCTQ